MKGYLVGLVGFVAFVFQFVLVNNGDSFGLSEDVLVSSYPWIMFVSIPLLWYGIITSIRRKGANLLLGIFLCLIAPLGWLIVLLLRNRKVTPETSDSDSSRKVLKTSIAIFLVGLLALFVIPRAKIYTTAELEGLKETHQVLEKKGLSINGYRNFTSDDFIGLTGRNIFARLASEGKTKTTGFAYGQVGFDNVDPSNKIKDITDDDVSRLTVFANIRTLFLSNTKISDVGLSYLESLKKLKHLDVSNTIVTDVGLSYLESLKKLERLDVYNTMVTDAGVKKLKTALPNCHVNR